MNSQLRVLGFSGVLTFVVTMIASAAGPARADGAIAWSQLTGKLGAVQGFGSQLAAENAAKLQCGESDCDIIIWYTGGYCAAAVQGENGVVGAWSSFADFDPDQVAATLATFHCMRQGGINCTLFAVVCA
jgi:hypothetical protein